MERAEGLLGRAWKEFFFFLMFIYLTAPGS